MRAIILLFAFIAICTHNVRCAHIMTYHGEHYYFSAPVKGNWFDAQRACRERGFDIVQINDIGLHYKIEQTINLLGKQGYPGNNRWWIGATNNQEKHAEFYWASSGHRLQFSRWHKGEPNNENGNENCVEITDRWGYDNNWNDLNCLAQRYYICGPRSKC